MASELQGVIKKLTKGEKIDLAAVKEIERMLDILRAEGWSGYFTADEAMKILKGSANEELLDALEEAVMFDKDDDPDWVEWANASLSILHEHERLKSVVSIG